MKVSKDFSLQEFIDPVTYQERGDRSIELLDNRIITIAQFFRDYFDVPVTINNWATGGQYRESGLRTFKTATGATYSQHKFGRAADLKLTGIHPEEVRNEIRKYPSRFLDAGLTTIEKDTPSWVHIDCRYTGLNYALYEVPYQ